MWQKIHAIEGSLGCMLALLMQFFYARFLFNSCSAVQWVSFLLLYFFGQNPNFFSLNQPPCRFSFMPESLIIIVMHYLRKISAFSQCLNYFNIGFWGTCYNIKPIYMSTVIRLILPIWSILLISTKNVDDIDTKNH